MPVHSHPIGKAMPRILRSALFTATAMFAAMSSAPAAEKSVRTSNQTEQATMQTTGNTILITGGGSGIGRALALRFNDLGNKVIVTGRRLQPLQETIAGRRDMHAIELDVTDPASIAAFARRVTAEHPDVNVLVNNAGIMRYEDVGSAGDLRDAEAQVATNLLGPVRLTNALIEHLKGRPNPVVVNVSSGLAFVPRADAAVYSATKAAIHAYTLSLRRQLEGRVKVIELIPPAVQTELTPGQSSREGYLPLDSFIDEVMALFGGQPTPDEIVVERARLQRWAEREGRFEQVFDRINANAARQRG
jgi:uncharacterized oxidoreductase